jgi:hypothetical protein
MRDLGIDRHRITMAVALTGMPTKQPGGFQEPAPFATYFLSGSYVLATGMGCQCTEE